MGSRTELAMQYRVGKFGTELANTESNKYQVGSNLFPGLASPEILVID